MKAILVIDEMPKTCEECRYGRWNSGLWCGLQNCSTYRDETGKDEDCPLKPLPQKKDTGVLEGTILGQVEQLVFEGWNRCIDEILGGNEQ